MPSSIIELIAPSRRRTVQLHIPLLKPSHDLLPTPPRRPVRESLRQCRIPRLIPHQQMPRQQQRVLLIVRACLEPLHARRRRQVRTLLLQRQERPTVCERVLFEQNCGGERLDGKRGILVVPCGVGEGPGDLANSEP